MGTEGGTPMTLYSFCPLVHKQGETEATRLGWVWMLTFHAAAFHCTKPSFLSLCPFPTFPSSCPRVGRKSWKKAVSVPSHRSPLEGLQALWAPCLMQGVTAGEEAPLSSMCPKPGSNWPSWPAQPCHRTSFLGFCPFEVPQI